MIDAAPARPEVVLRRVPVDANRMDIVGPRGALVAAVVRLGADQEFQAVLYADKSRRPVEGFQEGATTAVTALTMWLHWALGLDVAVRLEDQ